jgi:hypothetical protein
MDMSILLSDSMFLFKAIGTTLTPNGIKSKSKLAVILKDFYHSRQYVLKYAADQIISNTKVERFTQRIWDNSVCKSRSNPSTIRCGHCGKDVANK